MLRWFSHYYYNDYFTHIQPTPEPTPMPSAQVSVICVVYQQLHTHVPWHECSSVYKSLFVFDIYYLVFMCIVIQLFDKYYIQPSAEPTPMPSAKVYIFIYILLISFYTHVQRTWFYVQVSSYRDIYYVMFMHSNTCLCIYIHSAKCWTDTDAQCTGICHLCCLSAVTHTCTLIRM